MFSKDQCEQDLQRYMDAMMQHNGWQSALAIERRYGLDGYPPDIVSGALAAGARGEDMDAWIDNKLGNE